MKITQMSIQNVKSFRRRTPVLFDPYFNIIIGPNGGGKSNLLDIITVVVRHFFIPGYRVNEGQEHGIYYWNLSREQIFSQLDRMLEKFIGENDDSIIELQLTVGQDDLKSMEAILEYKQDLEVGLNKYRSKPTESLDFLDRWNLGLFQEGQNLSYTITNGKIMATTQDAPETVFREYLNYLEMFLILASDIPQIHLTPSYLYFSPYRGANVQDVQANLSREIFQDQLVSYFSTTSKDMTSLIKIATLYFADKHRRHENAAVKEGYESKWEADNEVKIVKKHMNRLGYNWNLGLVDRRRNIYEIALTAGGRDFTINQASSGEKEIINFLFGILTLNIRSGLIVIDEPDLHLHPKWQKALLELLIEVGRNTGNQIVLATHSPTFIAPQTIGNVRRVFKDCAGATQVQTVAPTEMENTRALFHIVTTHNNERMFFADKVALVEGIQDRLVFEGLLNLYSQYLDRTEVVEVLEVHGKHNFESYRRFLESMGVEVLIIADQDYVLTIGDQDIRSLFAVSFKKITRNVLRSKKSKDRASLAMMLESAIASGNLESLQRLWEHIKGRHARLRNNLSGEEAEALNKFLKARQQENIFILSQGEIEDYLPDGSKDVDGTIELVKEDNLRSWLVDTISDDKRQELDHIVFVILGASPEERDKITAIFQRQSTPNCNAESGKKQEIQELSVG